MTLDPKYRSPLFAVRMLAAIAGSIAIVAFADDTTTPPAKKAPTWRQKLRPVGEQVVSDIKDREFVQMVTAVLSGSMMGPGDGWFHPSQMRYGWDWLAERHHVAADESIAADKFQGDKDLFARLDRDRDGKIKAEDFDWSSDPAYIRQMSQSGQWFRGIDTSSNGRITRDEWDKYFERVAGAKGFITPEDLRAVLFPPPSRGSSGGGPSMTTLLKGLFEGELGSPWEGPPLNALAPDFELKTQDGASSIRLSSFRDKKPVVLIFGSFT